jgi:hypothetical protein
MLQARIRAVHVCPPLATSLVLLPVTFPGFREVQSRSMPPQLCTLLIPLPVRPGPSCPCSTDGLPLLLVRRWLRHQLERRLLSL